MDRLIKVYDDELDIQTCDNLVDKFEQFENQHELFDVRGMIFTQLNMAKSPQIWNTEIEKVKGGLSNSMKRAGVQWGIGRYLYKLPTTFAKFTGDGRFKTRIDGSPYRWNPPALSEEFLPPKTKTKGDK